MIRLYRLTFFIVIFTQLLISGCKQEEEKAPPSPPPAVTVARPMVQDVTNYVYFSGYTEARKSVELRARVKGFLSSFSFTPGGMVKKGDLLFVIDPRSYAAKVEQAKSELQTRQAEKQLARASLKRKENAYREKAVSELAVLEAKAQFSKAQAEVKGAEAALINAELDLSYTQIHAPIGGRISRNYVDTGNLVGGGEETLLATLVNYDPVYVYFNMDERSLMLYKTHNSGEEKPEALSAMKVPVYLALEGETGYPREGVGDYLDNKVDLTTGTIQVRAIFENNNLYILPGLFARLRIPYNEEKDALLVPDAALAADQRGRYLLTVNSDNIVEYKPVVTGDLVDGMRVIRKGISAQDRVVVKGLQRARPGSPVTPEEEVEKQQSVEKRQEK